MNAPAQPTWSNGITGPHLEIAKNPATPLRVLAGPGTGKTFALMRRICRLLEEGADPKRILVSTFTRTAATDLEKALSELHTPGAHEVRAGTLHSLCFGILNRAEVLDVTQRTPRPLMKFEERFLIQDLLTAEIGVKECKKFLASFNAAWARLQSDSPGWLANAEDKKFDENLRGWLTFHEAMLIGEVVPECRQYLKINPACEDRNAFDHVLVDEYQDLNKAEQELLDLLAEAGTLTVIGDENQSIYSFKHAHPAGIVDFPESHKNTKDQNLEVCRRCPSTVVKMANALLVAGDHNARQMQAFPQNPPGKVHLVQWSSMEAEAAGLAEFIEREIKAGKVKTGEVLVLAPRRQFGYAIRDQLTAKGILAHSFFAEEELDGSPKKLDESQAQQAFALLTLLAKPEDKVALRCWCGFGSETLRAKQWADLGAHCVQKKVSLRGGLADAVAGKLIIKHAEKFLGRFAELLALEAKLKPLVGQVLVDELFPAGAEWSEPLRELAAEIEEKDFDANTLLEEMRSAITQPEMPTETDFVRIMSLHKSKGLTATMVIVVGLLEGLVPGQPDPKSTPEEQAGKLAEDRRVFYVALTRSKETLVLSSVTHLEKAQAYSMRVLSTGKGQIVRTKASRFLAELGPAAPNPITGQNFLKK
jgi:DNA helicase II / ATP-dependent DNA helicase PcrA